MFEMRQGWSLLSRIQQAFHLCQSHAHQTFHYCASGNSSGEAADIRLCDQAFFQSTSELPANAVERTRFMDFTCRIPVVRLGDIERLVSATRSAYP
jgi:hypothetical protein